MTFQRVCATGDVEPAEGIAVTVNNAAGTLVRVGIIRDEEGDWHAIADTCTHGDVSLSEGDVEDGCVECWGHSARFNLVTGEPTLPATQPVAVYDLRIEGDDVLVDVDPHDKKEEK